MKSGFQKMRYTGIIKVGILIYRKISGGFLRKECN